MDGADVDPAGLVPPELALSEPARVQDLSGFRLPAGFRGRPAWVAQLWWLVQATLFGLSPQVAFGWRRWLLRRFGARIGPGARIRPSARCVLPWRLSVGAGSWIGDDVRLHSLDRIEIGTHACVSHGAVLCAGGHDPEDPAFAMVTAPVRVGDEAWVAAGAFVAPGVTVGRGAVVGMRALVLHDVPEMMVAFGHPARPVRRRGTRTSDGARGEMGAAGAPFARSPEARVRGEGGADVHSSCTRTGGARPLRLLIVGPNAPPEPVGIARYTGQMAAWLAARGHAVELVCAPPSYPDWRVPPGFARRRYAVEDWEGARLTRCPAYVPSSLGGGGRLLHAASFALTSLPAVLWRAARTRPDVVLCVAPALSAAPGAWLAARLCGARAWLHVQDLEVDTAFGLGLLRGGAARGTALALERVLLRRFDRVTTISEPMRARLVAKGVAADRLELLANWVDTAVIRPLPAARRARAAFGLPATGTVALYAGSFARKQGLEVLVEAARRLADRGDVTIALFGRGPAEAELRRRAAGLRNVRIAGLVPGHRLNELLNCADVHLLPRRVEATDLGLPSKLGAMLASGRPTVAAAAPGSGLAAAMDGCGLALSGNDPDAFAAALRALADDPERRRRLGAAARARALARFDAEPTLMRLEAMLHDEARRRSSAMLRHAPDGAAQHEGEG